MDYLEFTFSVEPKFPGEDILVTQLAEIGFESFDSQGEQLLVYIPEPDFNENDYSKVQIVNNPEFQISYSKKVIKQQNWNEEWENSFEPVMVGTGCVIKAPFHTIKGNFDYTIEIEPKMSFGTGHHQTTYLMTQKLLEMDVTNKSVLDMGCGTAVLGILAAMKNAKTVVAIDIEEWAAENSIENGERNNITNMKVLQGDASLLGSETFDVILANINRNILVNDVNKYVNVLNSGGTILMSGFFTIDIPIIQEAAEKNGLKFVSSNNKDNWAICVFEK